MGKIQFSNKKSLRLTNVLKYKIVLEESGMLDELDNIVKRMENFIKINGSGQVGPLIQYMNTYFDEQGNMLTEVTMMLQSSNYIHRVEKPFFMESQIKVSDALYCRFCGPESMLSLAYSKIKLEAFENDIMLKGDSYTIFVSKDEENETIVADVFMECVN